MNTTTKNGIYYPDDYNKIADIPEDMKKMAESIEKIVDENITNIKNIKFEQITQNEHIQELEIENERLKEDLNNIAITGQASGESITINDSAEARFPKLKVSGNSWQETREGYNEIDLSSLQSQTVNGVTLVNENGKFKLSGTATENANFSIPLSLVLNGEYTVALNNNKIIGTNTSNSFYAYIFNEENSWVGQRNGYQNIDSSATLLLNNEKISGFRLSIPSGVNVDGVEIAYQVEKGNVKHNWEQYGATPSPEYSSEIRNCGDNINILKLINTNKTINGVEFTVNKDGSITAKGTATEQAIYLINSTEISTFLESMPKGNYVLSGGISSDAYIQIYTDKASSTGQYYFSSKSEPLNINFDIDVSYTAYIVVKSGVTINDTFYPKLEKGTKATPYTPYGTRSINAKIQNENIFDGELEFGNIDNTGNNNGTSKNYIRTVNYINVTNFDNIAITIQSTNKWTQEYYITYDKDKKIIQRTRMRSTVEEVNEFSKTIDVKNASYVRFFIYNATAFTTLGDNKWILTEGTEIKPYTPHQEQNFTFPLLEGQRLYKDSYLADDGIHHKRGQVVLTGNENWQDYTTQIEGYYKAFTVDIKTNSKFYSATNPLCNYFIAKNVSYVKEDGSGIYSNQYATYISVPDTVATNVNELKSYLAEQYANGKPVILEYELAEEVIEPYTEEQQKVYNEIKKTAHSYKGTTHIFSNDEISPIFEATYIKDLETYIKNLIASEVANES